ncbi:MAG: hypothetical protein AAFX50_09680 [Acidobacteriota bacterium]
MPDEWKTLRLESRERVAGETLGSTAGGRVAPYAFNDARSGAAAAPLDIHTDGGFRADAALVEPSDEGLRRKGGEGLRDLERALRL